MPAKGPLADFFNSYSDFIYNHHRPATKEYKRLCAARQWPDDSPSRKKANRRFRTALIKQFNSSYGTDVNDLGSWQGIYVRIRIDPIPDSITDCKKVVQRRNVNLIDLLDAYDGDRRVKMSKTQRALSDYTLRTGKIFPRDEIGAGDLLKHLLRQIINPPD